jgi:2-keto-4-pentenoate hydratase
VSRYDTVASRRHATVEAAVARLREAARCERPCEPVRDLLGSTDVALAYEVQQTLTVQRVAEGARIVGRKIGLTSPAVQAQIGVDRPDFGVLFDNMARPSDTVLATDRLLQPKAEAEIAFVLAADLADGPLDHHQVRGAIAHAVAALEIVDSRVRAWDIAITDTVADNASSGMFVLGTQHVDLNTFEPVDVTMRLLKDDVLVATGDGRACLGDPILAVCWLARTAREFGAPLRSGEVVLSGALGAMVDVTPGCTIVAELSVLGRVAASFSTKESA